jgi:hypothetical protein
MVNGKKIQVKSKLYFYWGWNRSFYTNSDIHFTGKNYNFTLNDVVATDKQTRFALNPYLNPLGMTIPQFNARIGYKINKRLDISLGDDHMKYKMVQDQVVKVAGSIQVDNYTKYNGTYDYSELQLKEDFLTYQHCDGLNYLNLESRYNYEFNTKALKIPFLHISIFGGLGLGALMPRTEARLLMNERYHEFHFAGYGGSLISGLNIRLGNHFFIQSEAKGGGIRMPDVRTTHDKNDKASQNFYFFQRNIVFGYLL